MSRSAKGHLLQLPLGGRHDRRLWERSQTSSNIRQFPQGQLKCKAPFPDIYGGSHLGLITLIGAHETEANVLCVVINVTNGRSCMQIENSFAFEDALVGSV